jgi:hypothetical protein
MWAEQDWTCTRLHDKLRMIVSRSSLHKTIVLILCPGAAVQRSWSSNPCWV